ncbi:MAG: PEP-CTERM sorting domain-containing protein [Phycisphaerae bacterium]|nr:PEP-CTERM sorting domain-containing protein [Phycisphaerae bacterium]
MNVWAGVAWGQSIGMGVIGDSLSDEYEFADGGNHSAGRNWLEQLVTSRGLDFGAFSETSRGEPRNQGYAYNWARAGDTTGDLLSRGQHTGLVGQIEAGDVGLAFCWIGENDFTRLDNLIEIYYGDDSVWQGKVADAIDNVEIAIDAVLAAVPNVNLVVGTIPEIELNPAVRANFPDPAGRARLSAAIADYNDKLVNDVIDNNPRIAVADVYQLSLDILALYTSGHNLVVGGYEVDLGATGVGDEPDNIILSDNIHPGTIAQGLMANEFIDAMNTFDGIDVTPLSDLEILINAGVPEPASLVVLACGGLLCLRKRRKAHCA